MGEGSFDGTTSGSAGDDTILGGNGDDFADGGDGNDGILGGDGNDLLTGGGGQDYARGEAGDDVLFLSDGNDLLDGGDGEDWLAFEDVDLPLVTSGVVVSLQAGITFRTDFTGSAALGSIEHVEGTSFDDDIQGSAVDNVLIGLDGDDLLVGLAGDDLLDGGQGEDTLDGGEGNDTFIVADNGTDDLITDFGSDDILGISDLNVGNLRGTGTDMQTASWTNDATTLGADTGLFISNTAISGLTALDIQGEAGTALTAAIETNEDFYLLVSDGTDAVLAKIDDDDGSFTTADVTIVATLSGIGTADLAGLTTDNFSDW